MKLQRHPIRLFTVFLLALCIAPNHQALAQKEPPDETVKKGLIPFDYMDELEAKVEVNLTDKLIKLVTKSVSSKPEVAEMIQMIDGIYVRTYGNFGVAESGMIKYYQDKLKKNNWEVLVKIKESDEIVEISLLLDDDVAYGIFVIVASKGPDEVTFINIAGEIAPERISELLGNLSKFGMTDIDLEGTLKAKAGTNPDRGTIQKDLLAVKIENPPTIDGNLDDKCWKIAPQANVFTLVNTEKPVKDQSIVKLVYTDKSIYVAWHLYDSQPNKIVSRQKKDSARFADEDSVTFSIDSFHTHRSTHRTLFMANPHGKKYIQFASKNHKKSELTDRWKVETKIVDDGWTVEMEIPWHILDYPETTEPIQMGINFYRKQQRTGEHSWWSNVGVEELYENDGNWMQVLPPSKSSRMQGMLDVLENGEYNASGVFNHGNSVSPTEIDFFRIVNTSGLNPVDGLRIGGGFELGKRWNTDPLFFDRSGGTIQRNVNVSDTSIGRRSGPFAFGTMSLPLRTVIPNYRLGGGVSFGEKSFLTYSAQIHRLTSVRDRDILLTGNEQFWRAFFDSDFQDYYFRQGGVMNLQWQHASFKHTLGLSLLLEEQESIDNKLTSGFKQWYSFSNLDVSQNPPIYDGRMHSISIKYDFDTRENVHIYYDLENRVDKNEWYNTFLVEHSNPAIGSTYDFTRFVVHLRNYHPIGDDRIDTRLKVGLAATPSSLPYQRQFVLGGTGTLRGYSLHEFVGNHGFLFNFEYVHSLTNGFFIVPFVDIGQAWENLEDIKDIYPQVNLGIGFQLDFFRLNLARSLEKEREYQADFQLSQTF